MVIRKTAQLFWSKDELKKSCYNALKISIDKENRNEFSRTRKDAFLKFIDRFLKKVYSFNKDQRSTCMKDINKRLGIFIRDLQKGTCKKKQNELLQFVKYIEN